MQQLEVELKEANRRLKMLEEISGGTPQFRVRNQVQRFNQQTTTSTAQGPNTKTHNRDEKLSLPLTPTGTHEAPVFAPRKHYRTKVLDNTGSLNWVCTGTYTMGPTHSLPSFSFTQSEKVAVPHFPLRKQTSFLTALVCSLCGGCCFLLCGEGSDARVRVYGLVVPDLFMLSASNGSFNHLV